MWGRHLRLPAVLLLALSGRAADSPQSQLDYLAASLEKGDAAGALSVFDPKIGNFAEIKRDIEYLATLSGTTCDIKIELAEASGPNVALNGEWTLRLNPKQNGPLLVRTEKISVSMRQSPSRMSSPASTMGRTANLGISPTAAAWAWGCRWRAR